MKKKTKLKICDWGLIALTGIMLVSGLQLEVTGGEERWAVWVHIAVGLLYPATVIWHLYLHFAWREWAGRLSAQKSPVTKWLSLFGVLTVVSAVVTSCHWMGTYTHSVVGAVHGKIGFVFMALAVAHAVKRHHFFL